MCVIVFKPAGAAVPPLSLLKHCWDKNSDGAGMGFSNRETVFLSKGFMTWKSFETFYNENHMERRVGQAIVFHFRIGTHGTKDAGNTHPFCVADTPAALRSTQGTYPVIMAHNGIFQCTPKLPSISDTGQFIVDACQKSSGDLAKHWKENQNVVGWSKMIILRPGNAYQLFGSWQVTDYDGGSECFFSNITWKPYVSTYTAGSYGGAGYDYDDGYSGDWWERQRKRGTSTTHGKGAAITTVMTNAEKEQVDKRLMEAGFVKVPRGSQMAWALGAQYKEKEEAGIKVWTADKGDHVIQAAGAATASIE